MKKSIVLDKKIAIKRVGEIYERLKNDNSFKKAVQKSIIPSIEDENSRKTANNKDYKVIGKILKDEYGTDVLSETTIWRLLRIKNKSESAFNSLINNNKNIKSVYNDLFTTSESKTNRNSKDTIYVSELPKDINVKNLSDSLDKLTEQVKEWETNLSSEPNLKNLKDIDNKVFILRKTLGKIIVKYDTDDEYI